MWINKTGRVSDRIELIGNIENCMYLVKGKEIMIIGGGMSFLAPTLEKQFNRLDLDPERVRYQLVLHSHFDHCGAVSYCKKRFPNLEVLASAYAKETLSKEKVIRIIESMNHDVVTSMGLNHEYGNMKLKFKAIPVDRVVKEGDIIDLGEGTDVRIFEIPGHSKCSIAGYVESEKMLFPSDSFPIPVNGDYEQLLPMPNDNFPTYVESLKKLVDLDIETIGYCHHGVFTGKECQRIVARSIKATESFSNRIIEKCRELGGMANYLPVFADEVTKDLNLSFVNIDLMEEVSKRMLESVIEAEGIKEAVS